MGSLIRSRSVIKVNEIFYSIQGESRFNGFPCIFIRLTGCNLRCKYCDTQYAYKKGRSLDIPKILTTIAPYPCSLVEITGGEPLLQKEMPALAQKILAAGYRVIVETNGSQDIAQLPPACSCILDVKTPDSGESENIFWPNLEQLKHRDEVKFVLMSYEDYDWAKEIIQKYRLIPRVPISFTPAYNKLSPSAVARWLLEDGLRVRLQLQMHKVIWPDGKEGL